MDTIKNAFSQRLLDKGIILQSGAIGRDKINLLSGAITSPLIETIWIFSGYDTEAVGRILIYFRHLYNKGCEIEMLASLRILTDIVGVQFPHDLELLTGHEEARHYFMFSFLLDVEDCIQSFVCESC